ncbi:ABC transporter permease [Deinococcus alpinitundrae]|uniref:ABC transporter permease n=1 Tax=Deinococcus alpinitundrae TaxID=468913 RepID=UPI001ED93D19|nr:ABC transporter permease [Deinococcus alpinitundrae]
MTTTLPTSTPEQTPGRFKSFFSSRPVVKLRRNKLAVAGLIMTFVFLMVAVFAPFIAAPSQAAGGNCLRDLGITQTSQIYNPAGGAFWKVLLTAPDSCYHTERESFSPIPTPPGGGAYFGTSQGYDIFYGMIWGTRVMMKLGLVIVAITLFTGIVVGAVSGYYGGWLDNLIQRFIDVMLSLPSLVLTIVLLTVLGPSISSIILAFCLTGWTQYARIVRGDILRTRNLEFVDAARSLGARDFRLIFKHVLPNSVASVLTIAILDLGTIPLSIAALSFLGIGLPVGYTDWGQFMSFARAWMDNQYWYVTVLPAAFIILFSLGWNLFGDAVRDAFDPRTR